MTLSVTTGWQFKTSVAPKPLDKQKHVTDRKGLRIGLLMVHFVGECIKKPKHRQLFSIRQKKMQLWEKIIRGSRIQAKAPMTPMTPMKVWIMEKVALDKREIVLRNLQNFFLLTCSPSLESLMMLKVFIQLWSLFSHKVYNKPKSHRRKKQSGSTASCVVSL